MAAALPSNVIAGISFVGRTGGVVKRLTGFKAGRHTVPDTANATTQAFLGRLCESELSDAAEKLFQQLRHGFAYKRRDIALSLATPSATITAKDFVVDLSYAFEEGETSRYVVTTTLRDVKDADVANGDALADTFSATFSDLSFGLAKGASVEAVIDVIEARDNPEGMTVEYPSDYRECTIAVPDVEAVVRCTAGALDLRFPRPGSPRELIAGFAAVREAFQISRVLAGLIQ